MDVLSDVLTVLRTGQPHATRSRTEAPWGVWFPPSDAAGCHVLLEGSCWLLRPGADPLALAVGDVVFVPHGSGYALADHPDSPLTDFRRDAEQDAAPVDELSIRGQGPVTITLCAAYFLDRTSGHPLLDELPDVIHLPMQVGRHPSLRATVDLLGAELSEPRAGTSLILSGLVDMLLLFVLRAWLDEQSGDDPTAGWAVALGDQAVLAALRAIHGRPQYPWTVQELAAQSGLSRAGFAKRFSALTSRTPLGYLTWWRMTLAAQLLRSSDLPLRVVAERLGYGEFALAKAFKREYGVAPGQYRQRKRPVPVS